MIYQALNRANFRPRLFRETTHYEDFLAVRRDQGHRNCLLIAQKTFYGAFVFFGDAPVPPRMIFESSQCDEQKSFEPKTGHKAPEKFRFVEQTGPVSYHVQRDLAKLGGSTLCRV